MEKGKKITLKELNEEFPNFKTEKSKMGGYSITHLPSGKKSCCELKTIAGAKSLIERIFENDLLSNRSYFRLKDE